MMRRFRAMLMCALPLAFSACRGSDTAAHEEPQPPAARIAGLFLAFGTSPILNVPDPMGIVPCDGALEILSGSLEPSYTTLYLFAGDDWTCVHRFTAANARRPHEIRVYLFYDISAQPDDAQLTARAAQLVPELLAASNEHTAVDVVLTLEDRLSDEDFARKAALVEKVLGQRVSRNALHPGAGAFGREKEAHGRGVLCGGDTVTASQDGAVFSEPDSLSWVHDNAACERLLIWDPAFQDLCVVDNEPVKCRAVSDRQPRIERVPFFKQLLHEASL